MRTILRVPVSRPARACVHVVVAVLGAMAALTAVTAFDQGTSDGRRSIGDSHPRHEIEKFGSPETSRDRSSVTILAWVPGGLSPQAQRVVRRIPGVMKTTLVSTQLEWLTRSAGPDGGTLDEPPAGFRIPLEVALVEPSSYAAFVAPSERDAVLSLERGQVLLSRSSSRLRRAQRGATLWFGSREADVVSEISDVSAGGYEALRIKPPNQRHRRAFLLAQAQSGTPVKKVERELRRVVGPRTAIRVRKRGETPFLRYGDAVPPQILLKQAFGEFSARPGARVGSLVVDEGWRKRNIGTYRVPILGRIQCHRSFVPQVRAALGELSDEGAASLVDPQKFAGCFASRHINWDPKHFLSHHSWGVALDLNAADNRFGTQGSQDAGLIEAMESNGLGWGGRWLIPDPMHFEWSDFPN